MAPAGEQPRDALSALLREANAAGDSYMDLSKKAIDPETGQQLGKPWINNLALDKQTSAPKPWQLRAIAACLGKPLTFVQSAAARQYLDFEVKALSGYSDDVRVVVSHLAGMTENEVRQYRASLEAAERVKHEQQ